MILKAAVLVGVMAFATGTASAASIDARQQGQRARIRQGLGSGELSPREAARLRAEQAAIRVEERHYRRTGGHLSAWERADLRRDLDRACRHIARQRHDGNRW
jgi:hypothetical protein